MEPPAGPGARSDDSGLDSIQFAEDIHHLISSVPPDNGSSFTALLELPPNQAMELLHSPDSTLGAARPVFVHEHKPYPLPPQHFSANLTFPTNSGLIERAARFSVFAGESLHNTCNNSAETSSVPSSSSANPEKSVESEPAETELFLNSTPPPVSDPTAEIGRQNQKSAKRKEREKKAKSSAKKSKSTENESSGNGQNLPYVHVRARRGQATDSHSLAERARREKINARMKLLQELVPGCNKISGTALVLDEIINHVRSLQSQVELLSMRLAAVNPRIDFNLDSLLAAESLSVADNDFPSIAMPMMWPELQVNGSRQQYNQQWHFDALHQQIWEREDENHNFVTPENSLLSYDDSANSASLHLNQLKMEL